MDEARIGRKVVVGLIIGIVLIVLGLIFAPFTIIGAGQRGVVTNFGAVSGTVLEEGLHFRVPIVQGIKKISIRVQKNDVKAQAASKDLQDVEMDVVVNYHIDPQRVNHVFQQIGDNTDVYEKIIAPNTNEVVKASTAEYSAQDVIQKRQSLKDNIDKKLQERLITYGVVLDDVSLTNVDFSTDFNKAIENKQIAQQEAERAKLLVEKAKQDAEANRVNQQALTPEILQNRALEKWDGKLPLYMGTSQLPFISIPQQ